MMTQKAHTTKSVAAKAKNEMEDSRGRPQASPSNGKSKGSILPDGGEGPRWYQSLSRSTRAATALASLLQAVWFAPSEMHRWVHKVGSSDVFTVIHYSHLCVLSVRVHVRMRVRVRAPAPALCEF